MDEHQTERRIPSPAAGEDGSPIIVGDSSTGPLHHMIAVPADGFYIAFESGSIKSDGTMSVSHASSNPYKVGPAGHQQPVGEKWTLEIACAGGGSNTTISSTDGIAVKIKPGDRPNASAQKGNQQFPNGYLLLMFSNGPVASAELNGVNIWEAGTTLEVDFKA